MIRTRFAPSPTGYLHVGGLRTALYSYLFAKKHGGKFLLRIEDTDRERYVADGVANILKSLYWAGIVPDEGVSLSPITKGGRRGVAVDEAAESAKDGKPPLTPPWKGGEVTIGEVGENGPYIQSERLKIYQEKAEQLLDAGFAYYCFCTPERLAELRETQQAKKLPTGYDGHCLSLSPDEVKEHAIAGERCVVRLKMPKEGETVFTDLIRGEVRFKNELVDDQVLMKSDGFPTYHFAVVVDDNLMGITHIIRGEEWISSVPKHIQIYKYFGWEIPQMAHLPLLLNADKSKLSKRQGDVSVKDYKQKGYLPEALLNFVAFLGWNPGTEKEIYSLEELIDDFDLSKVSKAGAVFNLDKLNWFNKQYIKKLTDKELVEAARPWIDKQLTINKEQEELLTKAMILERERITTLSELPGAIKFIFAIEDYPAQMLIWKNFNKKDVAEAMGELIKYLNKFSVQRWNKANLESKLGDWIKIEKGYNTGLVLWPMRVALSGQEKSPGPFEIAAVFGKEETIKRLTLALQKLV